MGRLTGKTCLVTGAGQGIGRAIAEQFTVEGANVVPTDLRPATIGDGLVCEALDVTDAAQIAAMFDRYGDIDVLVNCAGYVANGTILDCAPADFDRSLELNVRSAYLTISAVLPQMLARNSGVIINIASVVSSVMAAPNRFAYATSKAALVGLTMSVARDYAAKGIRCNAISPGTVDTPSLRERLAATGDYDSARQAFVARQLAGRLGEASEIAAIATLMASDEATFMTGSNVIIDGGMSL